MPTFPIANRGKIYIDDIDLSQNLNCLNRSSYRWLGPDATHYDQRTATAKARNSAGRAAKKADRLVRIDRNASDDAANYKILKMGSLVVSKGTRAEPARKNRLTLSDVMTLEVTNQRSLAGSCHAMPATSLQVEKVFTAASTGPSRGNGRLLT